MQQIRARIAVISGVPIARLDGSGAAYPGVGIGTGVRYSKSEKAHVESKREAGPAPAVLEKW